MNRSIKDLECGTRKRAQWLVERCALRDIHILITSTLRTAAEQTELYAQGRTKPGKIVTNAKAWKSWHNVGRAFDICFLSNKKATYSGPWNIIYPASGIYIRSVPAVISGHTFRAAGAVMPYA
jgi:hypothetical protein